MPQLTSTFSIESHKLKLLNFRINSSCFSRNRKLDIVCLVSLILFSSVRSSKLGYGIISQSFFRLFFPKILPPNKQSVSEARQKLSWKAFQYLLSTVSRTGQLWNGFRVAAIDGTTLSLPRTKGLLQEFGTAKNQRGSYHFPNCKIVAAVDVMSGQSFAAEVGHCDISERSLALDIIANMSAGDLVLLDRGLGGRGMYYKMACQEVSFIHRTPYGREISLREVNDFVSSGKKEDLIVLDCPDGKDGFYPLSLRIIRGKTSRNGYPVILITDLLDTRLYPRNEVLQLYKKRWESETGFLRIKKSFGLEKILSKTVNGVLQDIYAHFLVMSVTARLESEASKQRGLNRSKAVFGFKNTIEVVNRNFDQIFGSNRQNLDNLFGEVAAIVWRKQPGRAYPRINKSPTNQWTTWRAKHQSQSP